MQLGGWRYAEGNGCLAFLNPALHIHDLPASRYLSLQHWSPSNTPGLVDSG